jgi:GGDEF domain-containing protein
VLRARLQDAVAEPLLLQGVLLHPAASVGLAALGPGATRDEVLREADRALYADKRRRGIPGPRASERRLGIAVSPS